MGKKWNGKGKTYHGNGKLEIEGEYLNGKMWKGIKREYYSVVDSKLRYEGEYLNGEKNEKGKEYYENGKILFEGNFLNGKRNGKEKEYNKYGK